MKRHLHYWPIWILGNLLFAVLLSACSLGGGSSASVPATPTSAPTLTPTPTSATLVTYQGDGYSIGYPQDWTKKESSGQVVFSDSTNTIQFLIQKAPNPNGTAPTSIITDTIVNTFKSSAKNFKDENVPATATVGGTSWNQKAFSGEGNSNGVTVSGKFYLLSTNYPANSAATQTFVIFFGGPGATFDQTNTTDFQPMLASFKFA